MKHILYMCDSCADLASFRNASDLRILNNGNWICEDCYDEESTIEAPDWRKLPKPPRYMPVPLDVDKLERIVYNT